MARPLTVPASMIGLVRTLDVKDELFLKRYNSLQTFNSKEKMQPRSLIYLIYLVALIGSLFGCATAPQRGEHPLEADEVKFYEPTQLSLGRYETVKHLWVESWRTALWYPSYPTEEQGVAALKVEAARLGANGVINVVCSEDKGLFPVPWSAEPSLICYGTAIRVH